MNSANYLYNRVDKINASLAQRIEYFKTNYFSKFLAEGEEFVNDNPNDISSKAS